MVGPVAIAPAIGGIARNISVDRCPRDIDNKKGSLGFVRSQLILRKLKCFGVAADPPGSENSDVAVAPHGRVRYPRGHYGSVCICCRSTPEGKFLPGGSTAAYVCTAVAPPAERGFPSRRRCVSAHVASVATRGKWVPARGHCGSTCAPCRGAPRAGPPGRNPHNLLRTRWARVSLQSHAEVRPGGRESESPQKTGAPARFPI
jgi:hypothetical protein